MYFKAFQLFSPPLLVTLMNLKGFLKHVLCGCIFKQEKESGSQPSVPGVDGESLCEAHSKQESIKRQR